RDAQTPARGAGAGPRSTGSRPALAVSSVSVRHDARLRAEVQVQLSRRPAGRAILRSAHAARAGAAIGAIEEGRVPGRTGTRRQWATRPAALPAGRPPVVHPF